MQYELETAQKERDQAKEEREKERELNERISNNLVHKAQEVSSTRQMKGDWDQSQQELHNEIDSLEQIRQQLENKIEDKNERLATLQ